MSTEEHSSLPDPTPAAPSESAQVKADPESTPPSWWQRHRENIVTLLVALILAFGIRTFVAEARWIPSDSMVPTLAVGDRLVVEKVSYYLNPPQRGDIIVFDPPQRLQFPGAFIKRVIGVPGDRIHIDEGQVFINDVALEESYIAAPPAYRCPGDCPSMPPFASEFVVPQGAYFVMGDNRNDSQDSHIWGFLPEQNIIGHAVFRFWPPQRLQVFSHRDYPELSTLT